MSGSGTGTVATSVDDDESAYIAATRAYAQLTVQTAAEDAAGTNTNANILYDSQSEIQGNWTLFYADALERIGKDETFYNVSLTTIETKKAIAYLVEHYFYQRLKDFDADEITNEGYKIKRNPGRASTSALNKYNELMAFAASYVDRVSTGTHPDTYIETADNPTENYPDAWLSPIGDPEEIDELD